MCVYVCFCFLFSFCKVRSCYFSGHFCTVFSFSVLAFVRLAAATSQATCVCMCVFVFCFGFSQIRSCYLAGHLCVYVCALIFLRIDILGLHLACCRVSHEYLLIK